MESDGEQGKTQSKSPLFANVFISVYLMKAMEVAKANDYQTLKDRIYDNQHDDTVVDKNELFNGTFAMGTTTTGEATGARITTRGMHIGTWNEKPFEIGIYLQAQGIKGTDPTTFNNQFVDVDWENNKLTRNVDPFISFTTGNNVVYCPNPTPTNETLEKQGNQLYKHKTD